MAGDINREALGKGLILPNGKSDPALQLADILALTVLAGLSSTSLAASKTMD